MGAARLPSEMPHRQAHSERRWCPPHRRRPSPWLIPKVCVPVVLLARLVAQRRPLWRGLREPARGADAELAEAVGRLPHEVGRAGPGRRVHVEFIDVADGAEVRVRPRELLRWRVVAARTRNARGREARR